MSRSDRNAKAAEYFRLAPNYSAECIGSLSERHRELLHEGRGSDAEIVGTVLNNLPSSTKFALPVDGKLFDAPKPWMFNPIRPPFDVCAFEFAYSEANMSAQKGAFFESKSPKIRRAILLSVRAAPVTALIPIVGSDFGWNVSLHTVLLHDTESRVVSREEGLDGIVLDASDPDWDMAFLGIKFHRFSTAYKLASGAELDLRAWRGLQPLLVVFAQACAALSCTNVTTEVIRPNREARAARPESTLFDYHVLTIKTPVGRAEPHDSLGGSHASPRTHLRRGHIRQHPTAGRIWVNSCVVNPTAIGTVNKDYRIV